MTKAVGPAAAERLEAKGIVTRDNTLLPGTPALFVAVGSKSYKISTERGTIIFVVPKPYHKTEYWRHGALLPLDEGRKAAAQAARELREDQRVHNN